MIHLFLCENTVKSVAFNHFAGICDNIADTAETEQNHQQQNKKNNSETCADLLTDDLELLVMMGLADGVLSRTKE